ncbi:hypothetical protein L6452_35087 [Arctium lappa]|uniref:Uncharacterized protein n=1 Tax=Arctium lappa TaxID=4217 RepID=A0ACB8YKP0_ARCLA|nr:hypothetical protein L6452_35087 [Arctium lappa]
MYGWLENLANGDLEIAARSACVLDAGGMDSLFPDELLKHVDILSPNESELAHLTGMQTESFELIYLVVAKCQKLSDISQLIGETISCPLLRKASLSTPYFVPDGDIL